MITQNILDLIKQAGFQVHMRHVNDNWCYYTDGTQIGYLQQDRLGVVSISTVHKPNSITGTGFSMGATLDLPRGFIHSPGWADSRDRASVVKFKDWDAFVKSSPWNKEYQHVPL